jgi:MoxR-like ATPase
VSDIQSMIAAVLRHRIVLNYNAEAQGQTAESVIQKLVETIPLDRAAEQAHERIGHVLKA